MESKLFFLDARSNARGPYLKISERKTTNDSRATVVFPVSAVAWFLGLVEACTASTADRCARASLSLCVLLASSLLTAPWQL